MKKLSCLLFVALSVIFSSCSSDDNATTNVVDAELIGTWEGTSLEYDATSTAAFMGQELVSTTTGNASNMDFTLTFSQNPNVVTSEGSYDLNYTISNFGLTQTGVQPNVEFLNNGTWTQSGNTIQITDSLGNISEAVITQLTSTTLTLEISASSETVQQGIPTTVEANSVVTFTKM